MATGFAIIAPLARMLGRPLIEHLRYRFERCASHCLTRCHLTEHDRLKCRFRVKLGCLSDEKIDRLAFGSGQSRSPNRTGRRRICRRPFFGMLRRLRREQPNRSRCRPMALLTIVQQLMVSSEPGGRADTVSGRAEVLGPQLPRAAYDLCLRLLGLTRARPRHQPRTFLGDPLSFVSRCSTTIRLPSQWPATAIAITNSSI